MLIESKISKMHQNKVFEMRDGLNGSGKEIVVIQTMINNHCVSCENFVNHNEAKSWFEYACQ